MSFYLVSIFKKRPDQLSAYRAFREQRLSLVRKHGGVVVALFQPEGYSLPAEPDEIHILEFSTRETRSAFRLESAQPPLAERQSQAVLQMTEYASEIAIPMESVLATMISHRPVFPDAAADATVSLTEQLTMSLSRLTDAELHPAQRQAELDTVILHPESPAQRKLSALIQKWQPALDRRVIFAHTYYLMTTNMLTALGDGLFFDREWVMRLLDRFAEFYFNALDRYEKAPHNTPSVWRVAFEVARNPGTYVVQHLLLGVNAHINYDLSASLIEVLREDWPSLDSEMKTRRYQDHTLVNQIIATTFDDAQELVIARYAPSLDRLMQASMDVDQVVISKLINAWREQAWQQAVEYLDANTWEERHAARQKTEYIALHRADMIMLRQGPVRMKLLF